MNIQSSWPSLKRETVFINKFLRSEMESHTQQFGNTMGVEYRVSGIGNLIYSSAVLGEAT